MIVNNNAKLAKTNCNPKMSSTIYSTLLTFVSKALKPNNSKMITLHEGCLSMKIHLRMMKLVIIKFQIQSTPMLKPINQNKN